MAVGVGLVLARSERARRLARHVQHDPPEPQLGLLPREALPAGLQRMAIAQVQLALELLSGGGGAGGAGGAAGAPDEIAVHETRKALKRLRALLRVLQQELGQRGFERENAALRDVASQLSGSRDATVMLATLDALIKRHPRKLGRRRGVLALRARLAAQSARMQSLTLAQPAERAAVLGELDAFRSRVAAWQLPADSGLALIDGDLQRLYQQGRTRWQRVARGKGSSRALEMHKWRKRVKDLRYVAEMLERTGTPNGRLHTIATRADDLGELLGEEHDLAVLVEHLRAGDGLWRTGRRTRKALLKAIAKRRRTVQRQALRKGELLYKRKPRRFMRGVRKAFRSDAAGV